MQIEDLKKDLNIKYLLNMVCTADAQSYQDWPMV